MKTSRQKLIRRVASTVIATLTTVLVWGAGVSLARGINATKYYEDTSGNLCVGLEEVGGFENKSCVWGAQTGKESVGAGDRVLEKNTSGERNVAVGYEALAENEAGSNNTAVGWDSCLHSKSSSENTCIGWDAGIHNKTGEQNVSEGQSALFANTTGSHNVGIGAGALDEVLEGSSNTALGTNSGSALKTTSSNNVDIANVGVAGDSGTIRIGTNSTQTRAFMSGIYETTIQQPACGVVVNAAGQLGCKSGEIEAKVNSVESPALVSQLAYEHARAERQQNEIDQLASELRSLRREIDG